MSLWFESYVNATKIISSKPFDSIDRKIKIEPVDVSDDECFIAAGEKGIDGGDKYIDCNITGKWMAKNFSVLGVICCKAMQSYTYEYVEYDDYVGDADNDGDNHDYIYTN